MVSNVLFDELTHSFRTFYYGIAKTCWGTHLDSLTVKGIMDEVFSIFSSKYHEIRRIQISYLVQHWDEVTKTSAYERFLEGEDISFFILAEIMKEKSNQAKVS
ncbi:hypothetical protein BT69DRAFT_809215 [Atractiella rhizophila]|nr:hypothetical protein BT69DRAFT_809215 [Atractiella rhizophila]